MQDTVTGGSDEMFAGWRNAAVLVSKSGAVRLRSGLMFKIVIRHSVGSRPDNIIKNLGSTSLC